MSSIPTKLVLAAAVCALGQTGCYARGGAMLVYDVPAVEVETVPVEIVSYPRYVYRGSYAYLVDGRWYYRHGGRWVVFRREPRELYEARIHSRVRPAPRRPTHVGLPPGEPPPETRDHR